MVDMMTLSRSILFSLLISFGVHPQLPARDLNEASGRLFKPDLANRSFEFLTETEYDPKTDIGQSRFTVYWSKDVEIVQMAELKDFSSISGPVIANFRGIDNPNAKALLSGEAFIARVATLFEGVDPELVHNKSPGRAVSGPFTPDSDLTRAGLVEIGGKLVQVSLRDRNWRIFYRKRIQAEQLTKGFWSVKVYGAVNDSGRFVANRLEVESLPDPRLTDDPNLPRVLVIGDSISMNYHNAAKEALTGIANYHRIEGNGFSVIHGVNNAELWLGNYHEKGFHWDVILFNHGLHDLKQAYDAETDTFGAYAVSLEDYKANLEKLIGILKRTGATLVWTSTTPIPNDRKGSYARRKGVARIFNAAAMKVMQRHSEIITNDLYRLVDDSSLFDEWRKGDDVHFYEEKERELIGEAVASAVRQALARRSMP